MALVIDRAAAIDGLRQAVDERGEGYVYPTPNIKECRYINAETREPSCMVGLAMAKLGVPLSILEALDKATCAGGSIGAYVLAQPEYRHHLGDVIITEEAARVFGAAQMRQDRGATWGLALKAAESYALGLAAPAGS